VQTVALRYMESLSTGNLRTSGDVQLSLFLDRPKRFKKRRPMIDTSTPRTFRYKIEWFGGLIFFVGGSLFATIGVCMIRGGEMAGWFIAGFFGLIPCICLLRLLPGCAFLRVSRRGVELRESFRSVLFPWDEIESFNCIDSPRRNAVEMVVADPDPDPAPDPSEDARERIDIPHVYGPLPLTLANLLNDWKLAMSITESSVNCQRRQDNDASGR